MFRSKLKLNKCEQPEKTGYTIHDPHTVPLTQRQERWVQPYYQIVSIDPAATNLGLRIERRYHSGVFEPLVFLRMNLKTLPMINEEDMTCYLYKSLTTFLDQYLPFLRETHLIVVERQLPENYRAVRISQHIISYLCFHLINAPLLPVIYEVESRAKYTMLGAPSTLNNKTLKKVWGPEKAREILQGEGDSKSLLVMEREGSKVDDLADTVLLRRVLELLLRLPIPESVVLKVPAL